MILNELVEPALELVPQAAATEAIRTMVDRGIDVGVVLEGKRPVGIVTEKELVERLATLVETEGGRLKVTDVMRPVETVGVGTPTVDAARAMREHGTLYAALTEDDGTFSGIVALRRLLMEVVDEQELKVDNLQRELMADGPGG